MSAPTRPRRGPAAAPKATPPKASSTVSSTSAHRFAARARARRWITLRRLLGAALCVGILGGLGWVALASPWLAVDDIVVTGEGRAAEAEILRRAAVEAGTPLLRVDTDAVSARVGTVPEIASVQVERRWPRTLEIVVSERNPLAVVPAGESFRFVDAEGVLFGTTAERPASLPALDPDTAAAGEATFSAALAALAALPEPVGERVVSVSARTPDDVVLRLTRRQRVVWGGPEQPQRKATVLQALMLGQRGAAVYDVSAPGVPVTRARAVEE